MNEKPDSTLDHLLVDRAPVENFRNWATSESYNNAVKDATRVKCYICGASGHFIEVCPLYCDLDNRFGKHGLRSGIWGRAIKLMAEKQKRK